MVSLITPSHAPIQKVCVSESVSVSSVVVHFSRVQPCRLRTPVGDRLPGSWRVTTVGPPALDAPRTVVFFVGAAEKASLCSTVRT